jgi:hypothetical protein
MQAIPIEIQWHPRLPIFAREQFLQAVGQEYGWLGGRNESGEICCILPYTIITKAVFRFVRFRVETIPVGPGLGISQEKEFLASCVDFFRLQNIDVIIPATTNSVFRTYPEGAIAAPYGSYIIDLLQAEDILWHNIERITRQNIKTAIKKGVTIQEERGSLRPVYELIRNTFKRSRIPFMDYASFKRFIEGLGEYGLILKAEYEKKVQSYVVFAFSEYCAYAIYAGNVLNQIQGANKLLYWEAIKHFKHLGIRKYDFAGARINPEKGSKQEALCLLKRHFGAGLIRGYMWKYPLKPFKYLLYNLAAKLRSGGDIVDAEKHKLIEGRKLGD